MVRPRDRMWKHGREDGSRFICNYCNKDFPGGVCRLKSHLSGLPGRDVALCTQVPEDVQVEVLVALGKGSAKKKKRSSTEFASGSAAGSNTVESVLEQTTIPAMTCKKDKEHVDMKVAAHFFLNNIAFNVIQTPPFLAMIKAVAEFGVGYKPPSYSTLRTKLKDNTRKNVEKYVEEVKKSWVSTGCSIMSDMWTDMNGRSYINVIAYSPRGPVFLKSFERSKEKKTGFFLRNLIISVIEEIGPENVIQVIFDNASNYGLAGEMIMDKYGHIFRVKCAAHGVQLLLKDIYNVTPWVRDCIDEAKCIVDYMKAHGAVKALLRELTENELKGYCSTRFASHFLMLQSVLKAEAGLRHTVASSTWLGLPYTKKLDAKKVENIIHDSEFWSNARDIVSSFEPLVRVLRLVDGDGATSAYLFEAMERARESLNQRVKQNPEKYSSFLEQFEYRRHENILHESHAAAAYLNPTLMYDGKISFDRPEVKNSMLYLGDRLLSLEEKQEIGKELLIYGGKDRDMFNYISIGQMRSAHPRVWWEANGSKVPILKKIAIRVLGQPCSASACERNWSAFEAAQTKKRNRLLPENLDDLVYIRTNTMMFDASHEFEMRDRQSINLDNLGELLPFINDGRDEDEGIDNDNNDNEAHEEFSWLDSTLPFL